MKSGKYILKNQYQEKLSDNDSIAHQKNLMNINYKSTVTLLNKKEFETLDQQKRRNKNMSNAAKFQQTQLEKERAIENQSLVDRMLKIHNSPNKNNQSKDMSSSSLVMQRSLIQLSQKKEDQRIYDENIKLAKRMMNLPPVINTNKLINNYRKHESKSFLHSIPGDVQNAKKYHKLQPLTAVPKPTNKYSVYVDVLNDLTNNKFEQSKSHITFPNIESKINRNTLLCLVQLQNLYLLNNYDLKNPKVPP